MEIRLENPGLYTVGWIAALPIERAAATAMLDELHEPPEGFEQHLSDTNSYTWGRIGEHNIAIASLPAGVYGTASAATTASNLLASLPQIRIGLLVGIGGGLARPYQGQDIRLGDVVVGQPEGTSGGVIQYDLGKAKLDWKWELKGSLNKPPSVLLHALSSLQAHLERAGTAIPNLLQELWNANPLMKEPMDEGPGYIHQGCENDRLFQSKYGHVEGSTCDRCDQSWEFKRKRRARTTPRIHYGVIASGNSLVKDAMIRDRIAEFVGEGCMCFEMEAAGLMDHFPCLVIRGICDYADSHKNDRWQRYASATAAAYAKELLGFVPTAQLRATQRAIDVLKSIDTTVKNIESSSTRIREDVEMVSIDVRQNHQKMLLERLPVAEGASFDSHAEEHNPTCLEETRVAILQDISTWANASSTKPLFWLNGMAGTGKSTISRTVARTLSQQGILGASFFFKRGEGDRGNASKVITTIAAQIAAGHPRISSQIAKAIESDSTVISRGLREQFTKLILEPLLSISQSAGISKTTVIVLDALDECEREDDIQLLIYLFSRAEGLQSVPLKTFVTSRPDLPILLGFNKISGNYHDFLLHEMPESVIEQDLSIFFHHELKRIRNEYNASVVAERRLAPDWPGQLNIQALTEMAKPLFIFAATTCRFLADRKCGNPDKQLQEVLLFQTRSQESKLDATYLPVLNRITLGLSKKQQTGFLQQFHLIIGSIINLASPLSASALAELLNVQTSEINDRIDILHSVLDVPLSDDAPIRMLHLSFRDFLLDPDKQEASLFWINEKQAHHTIALNCLRAMKYLREDICDIKVISTQRSIVDKRTIDRQIPPHVQYACRYWIYHVHEAGTYTPDCEQVYGFLTCHFLHWLEALSLLGMASGCIGLVRTLQSVFQHRDHTELSAFLEDSLRFILANIASIDSTPLQIYSSLLVFAPQNSKVRATFKTKISSWFSLNPKTNSEWAQYLQTLEGHSSNINAAVFSHDSMLIASASHDHSIRVWRTNTGEHIQSLTGHNAVVNSVIFSHDSKLLASASYDKTVKVWRVSTGECTQILRHRQCVRSASFSYDSTLLAAAVDDKRIQIWRTNTRICTRILTGHSDRVNTAVFSHDARLIVSASDDATIRFWSLDTGKCIRINKCRKPLTSAIFSHDSRLLAFISYNYDEGIRIWCMNTSKCIQTLRGHGGSINSISFSHDSQLLASASEDATIRIWCIVTGKCVRILESNGTPVNSIDFSHDSTLLASASDDNIIRIWPAKLREATQTSERHNSLVTRVSFSPNSRLVATTSPGGNSTIRLWRTDTGECTHTLNGHENLTPSLVFSRDSTLLFSASDDATVKIWRVDTGECMHTLKGHSKKITSISLSYNSKLVASASYDTTVRIWRTDTGECLQILSGHEDVIDLVAFSHDPVLLVSTSQDKTVRVWQGDTGTCIHILNKHILTPAIAFSHDSKLLAVGDSKNIYIWRTDTGECTQALTCHLYVNSLAFSHDGILLASTGMDADGLIWRTDTGECVQYIQLGKCTEILSFARETRRLLTTHGTLILDGTSPERSQGNLARNTILAPETPYTISRDNSWIKLNGKRLLWLPVEYRPECWAVSESTIVMGCGSGRVIMMRFASRGDL